MTSFDETKEAAKTAEETKPAEPIIPPSKVFSNEALWEEACEFAGMLTYCRPHQSKTERKFIAKYLVPLKVKFDKKGNIYKQIGDNPTVLWSCHTDTVHTVHGFQAVVYHQRKKDGDLFFAVDQTGKKKSACLGADDTCGVWLMTEMIKAEIPGLYIFHRGEECGGIGSKWISENNKDALKGIKFAIAFDRRDEKSIITFQRSKRCCSDDFAESLAKQLGMGHKCDETGSFTDTASYVDLIAECTNISVGYDGAHSQAEDTNVDYLFRLRDALLKLDVSKLVESRKPGENTYKSYSYYGGGYEGGYEGWGFNQQYELARRQGGKNGWELRKEVGDGFMDDYWWDQSVCLWFKKVHRPKPDLGVTKVWNGWKTSKNQTTSTVKPNYKETISLIKDNPAVIADLLHDLGYDGLALKEYLLKVGVSGNVIHM